MNITIKTLAPIAHGEYSDGADTGNILMFRKLPMLRDNGICNIPTISGNAIRGTIRRLLAREFIDRFDLKTHLGAFFDRFYLAIACGGMLEKSMDTSISPDEIRAIRKLLPMLSVLGAAMYRYMLSGMVNIGFAVLACKEMGSGEQRINDLLADVGLVHYVDRQTANVADAKPMPYETETVIAGAEFGCNIAFAPQATPVEIACVNHGINMISTLGGKSAAGFGRVEISEKLDDLAYLEWLESVDEIYIEKMAELARTM